EQGYGPEEERKEETGQDHEGKEGRKAGQEGRQGVRPHLSLFGAPAGAATAAIRQPSVLATGSASTPGRSAPPGCAQPASRCPSVVPGCSPCRRTPAAPDAPAARGTRPRYGCRSEPARAVRRNRHS